MDTKHELYEEVVRVISSDRCVGLQYHHDSRTQSPRLSADRPQLSGDLGSDRETQEEKRTQRASFVATYRTRVRRNQQSAIVLSSDDWFREMPREALHGQTRGNQHSLGRLSPGPSEVHSARLCAAPDTAAVVDVGLNFLSPNT